ncbi:hypothetical protein CO082_00220, partial [Candidatus Peregrinibacteria bacterium CG_4_9_14_0_8_um_filter_44_15]
KAFDNKAIWQKYHLLLMSFYFDLALSFSDSTRSTSDIIQVKVTRSGIVRLQTSTSVYELRIEDKRAGRVRSLQYLRRGYLDYDETMPDGFYDGGHGMEFEIDENDALKVRSPREVILVDGTKDQGLAFKLDAARKFIENTTAVEDKIKMLAMFVSNSLGGSQMVQGSGLSITDMTDREIELRKQNVPTAGEVVMLGYLNYGVCRHRALAFKYFADRLGIRSRLVRGKQGGADGGWHIWNVVELGGKHYVVDVMQQPWRLMEQDSKEVGAYQRAFNERGARVLAGIGGRSITR